jgi:hypothetical protein
MVKQKIAKFGEIIRGKGDERWAVQKGRGKFLADAGGGGRIVGGGVCGGVLERVAAGAKMEGGKMGAAAQRRPRELGGNIEDLWLEVRCLY